MHAHLTWCLQIREGVVLDFSSSLLNFFPQSRKEEWRKRLAHLEKTHSRQFKKTRAGLKKPTEALAKLEKKLKKNKGDLEMVKLRETLLNDLRAKKKMFEDQERAAVREVSLSFFVLQRLQL